MSIDSFDFNENSHSIKFSLKFNSNTCISFNAKGIKQILQNIQIALPKSLIYIHKHKSQWSFDWSFQRMVEISIFFITVIELMLSLDAFITGET